MEEPVVITERFIDVENLFAAKNPRLKKMIPGFVFRWLKKLIHQEVVNASIYKHRDKFGLPFVEAVLDDFGMKARVIRPEEVPPANPFVYSKSLVSDIELEKVIPKQGRFIFASNHPLGGLDGLAMLHTIGQVRKDVVFPVNDLLLYLPGLKPLFIPINKHGKNTDNIRLIEETFASDKALLYFPAGLVSRRQKNGVIRDLEWKKTFISKAKKYQRDIIPVYISGKNSGFFYSLANWRRRLGIKTNIEMLFLSDEFSKQKGKEIRLIIGEPIPWTTFDRSRSDAQWAAYVKEKVYQLNTPWNPS